jgi:hypothetical protein
MKQTFPFPRLVNCPTESLKEGKKLSGEAPSPGFRPWFCIPFTKNLASLASQFDADTNRQFQFQQRNQLFIPAHNETPSVAAMRVSNPDCSPFVING